MALIGVKTLENTIPRGAMVVRTYIEVIEGFTGATTVTAKVGDDVDSDRYVAVAVDVKTAGIKQTGKPSGEKFHKEKKNPKLTITPDVDASNLTAGKLRVTMLYVEP